MSSLLRLRVSSNKQCSYLDEIRYLQSVTKHFFNTNCKKGYLTSSKTVSIYCWTISRPFLIFSVVKNYNLQCGITSCKISDPRDQISVLWHILELCIRLGSINISVPLIQSTYCFYICERPKSHSFTMGYSPASASSGSGL